MRFLVLLIIALLAAFFFLSEPEPVPVEETFIGDQVKTLRKAEGYQDEYLKAADERQKRLERELEGAGG